MKHIFKTLFLTIISFAVVNANAQIVINEICVDNEQTLSDQDGDFPDWIELYNHSSEDVNLHNWSLTDDSDVLDKWTFPHLTIPAKGFLVIFASGKNRKHLHELHTSFKLDESEEHCFLLNPEGGLVSSVQNHSLPSDLSLGKIPDGTGQYFYFAKPTPGYTNNDAQPEFFDQNPTIGFSIPGGFYSGPVTVSLQNNGSANSVIRYTTDGSPVNLKSPVYSAPIYIGNSYKTENGLSFIPTSDTWQTPDNGVENIRIIRATPYLNDVQTGPEVIHSYLIGNQLRSRYPVDVVSLTIKPEDLFSDSTGIYVHGNSEYGNFIDRGMKSERKVFMESFSPDNSNNIRQSVGVRIHGRSSRYSPQKNLRIHGRERYGKPTITLPVLGREENPEHKELILQAPEPIFSTSLFTDELVQTIIGEMNIDLQHQTPAIVFINGEYWGVHHIRERLGKHYLSQCYDVDENNVDILDWDRELSIQEGDADSYNELIRFVKNHDLSSNTNYEILKSKLDVPSFIDYLIAQLFFANEDFPNNNVRLWREKTPSSKWRFLFFDADATMKKHWQNRLPGFIAGSDDSDPVSILFSALLRNENFKQTFAATYIHHLSTTFSPDNILNKIQEFKTIHEPLVSEHINRWNRPNSMGEWYNAIEAMKHFAIMRPPKVLEDLNSSFPKPFDVFPVPAKDYFNVKFFVLSDSNLPKVRIIDMLGSEKNVQTRLEGDVMTIDTTSLPTGVYLIQVDMGKMSYSDKIIIAN